MADDEVYKVIDAHKRVVFEGPEHAARAYVEANYPRPHSTLGAITYDAHLHLPDGSKERFHVNDGWDEVVEDA